MTEPDTGEPPLGAAAAVDASRARARLLLLIAALVVAAVSVRGATLWPSLPDRIPVRWQTTQSGTEWSSTAPVQWADKTATSVFGQLAGSLLALAVCAALVFSAAAEALLPRVRRALAGPLSPLLSALEVPFYHDMLVWVLSGVAVSMALDSWQVWSLALHQGARIAHLLSELTGPVVVLGLVWSTAATWSHLRKAH